MSARLISEAEFHANAIVAEFAIGRDVTTSYDNGRDLFAEHYVSEADAIDAYATSAQYRSDVQGDATTDASDAITRRYHASIIRAYRKGGALNIGSVVITATGDNATAACRYCGKRIRFADIVEFCETEREAMELFTVLVIAHGNNEFTQRGYKARGIIDTATVINNYRR
jgi:ribosomal protein S28E/S33